MIESFTILKKPRGKSKAICINHETQSIIKSFKERYRELLNSEDEVRDIDKLSIKVILDELDDFDQNLLIAFYAVADGSASRLAQVFGVAPSVITSRVKKIIKLVQNRVLEIIDDGDYIYY